MSILTFLLHDLTAIVEVIIDQPEYRKHKVLLLKLQEGLDLTADELFATERHLTAKSDNSFEYRTNAVCLKMCVIKIAETMTVMIEHADS